MKIDLHTHSKEISGCSHIFIEDLIDAKIKQGYQGMMICNHCQSWYYEEKNHLENMKKHIEVFEKGLKHAEKVNFKLFLGIEVTLHKPAYADYLLVGVTKEFLLNSPCLYKLTLEELYNYCKQYNVFIIQAHPYRNPIVPMDPKFINAVEINTQDRDYIFKDDVIKYANDNNLQITVGSDSHTDVECRHCGTIVADNITNSSELRDAFFNKEYELFFN